MSANLFRDNRRAAFGDQQTLGWGDVFEHLFLAARPTDDQLINLVGLADAKVKTGRALAHESVGGEVVTYVAFIAADRRYAGTQSRAIAFRSLKLDQHMSVIGGDFVEEQS